MKTKLDPKTLRAVARWHRTAAEQEDANFVDLTESGRHGAALKADGAAEAHRRARDYWCTEAHAIERAKRRKGE